MLGFIAKQIGGLVSDAIEVSKTAIGEVVDIPDKFIQGYNEGCIIDATSDKKVNFKEDTELTSEYLKEDTKEPINTTKN